MSRLLGAVRASFQLRGCASPPLLLGAWFCDWQPAVLGKLCSPGGKSLCDQPQGRAVGWDGSMANSTACCSVGCSVRGDCTPGGCRCLSHVSSATKHNEVYHGPPALPCPRGSCRVLSSPSASVELRRNCVCGGTVPPHGGEERPAVEGALLAVSGVGSAAAAERRPFPSTVIQL